MKIKWFCLFFILIAFATQSLSAQERTIKGVVLDEYKKPLIGATIIVDGTQQTGIIGTTADMTGNFTLVLPQGMNTLVFSYTGYITETANVEGKSFVEMVLWPSIDLLQEVVVTALGIKREEKALGYAVHTVGNEALQNSNSLNPLASLSGQVSGLQVSGSGSGPGGSNKILIRGTSSISGSNDPLYVIDGVPIDNSGGAGGSVWGGFDYGNAVNNINMEDVESITVLKGGAAAALYGSRGQNGVIMITTKRGKKDRGLGITYQTSFSFDNPLIKPELQTQYSQGSSGKFGALNHRSWGLKMNGQEVTNFLNQSQVLNPVSQHPYDGVFRQATNMDHNITLENRGEKSGVYFSAGWTKNEGMLPGHKFDRKSFNLKYDSKFSEFITLDARANYIYQDVKNRPNLAGSPDNPIYALVSKPVSVSIEQMENYVTVDGYPVVWTHTYNQNEDGSIAWRGTPPPFASSPLLQNPYWTFERNTNEDQRHRLLGYSELAIDFKKWFDLSFNLNLRLKAGMDYYNDYRERLTAHNTYFKAEGRATGTFARSEVMEGNYDALLTFDDSWGKVSLLTSVGGNLRQRKNRSLNTSSESGLINIYGPYVVQNFLNPIATLGNSRIETQSLYALASVDYDRKVFLDFTVRNDWTSVLSPENWSIFYPSVSSSWLINETFSMPDFIDLLKLRASWAAVGSGGQYSSMRYFQYGTNANQYFGLPYGFIPSERPEYDLRSELTVSKEVGVQTVFLKNRFSFDVTVYEAGTRNQIFKAPLAPSSGYNDGFINSGYIRNRGVEIQSNFLVLSGRDYKWNLGGNVTRQWSKLTELAEGIDNFDIGEAAGVKVNASFDQPVGLLVGSAFDRDDQGRLILDSESLPRIKTTTDGAIDEEQTIGKIYPDWLMGLNTNFSYKNFYFSMQFDSKFGHDIYSVTNARGAEFGTMAFTVQGRDEWADALEVSQITGTPPTNGYMVSGVKDGVEGEYPVDPQKYWDRLTRIDEAFVYDASYIRLRQISMSYNFKPSWSGNVTVKEIGLSLFVNNLAYLWRKTDNISPESSFGVGNVTGIEMYSYPEIRSIGASLKFSF